MGNRKKKQNSFFKKEDISLHLMALPSVLYLVIFAYIPMVGVLMAFQRYNVIQGFFRSQWVGLRNFEFLFSTTDGWTITRNTVLYFFAYQIAGYLTARPAALIMTSLRTKTIAKALQTVYMMPYFVSWAAVTIAVQSLLNGVDINGDMGVITYILHLFGLEPFNNNWYMTRAFWPGFMTFLSTWKYAGFSTVLYIAVISGISTELYEAAMIEGASKLQQARYITIPHLRFIITISIIMSFGSIMRGDFGLHFLVPGGYSGYLLPVIDILDTYVYRGLTTMSNLGMSAAAGLYQSFVGMVMILLSNWVVTKIDPDSAMI
jgi:putative aldouronate transport system permease protein